MEGADLTGLQAGAQSDFTGGNFRTANYPGVTVSLMRGKSKPEFGPVVNIVDLPGVHSAVAPSPESAVFFLHAVAEVRAMQIAIEVFIIVVVPSATIVPVQPRDSARSRARCTWCAASHEVARVQRR